MAADPADPLLGPIRDRIVAAVDPLRIVLFGSRARGDHAADSDYDLLVVTRPDTSTYEASTAIHLALYGLGISKDVIVYTPDEFAMYSHWKSSVAHRAAKEGLVLHASP